MSDRSDWWDRLAVMLYYPAMISTVIFDLDGLLSDTERLHYQAYHEALAEAGIPLTQAEYMAHWTRAGRNVEELLAARGCSADTQAIRTRKAARFRELVRTAVQPMPGACELLARLRGRKALALGSSSYREAVLCVTDALGMTRYFDAVATRDDVARSKPFPDIFLRAAEALHAAPAACVVIEDAERGVRAALAAGMACIAVPGAYTQDNDFSLATRVVRSLDEITLELLDSMCI